MAKQTWKPGNMVYPLPAVMVSVGDKEGNTQTIKTNEIAKIDYGLYSL